MLHGTAADEFDMQITSNTGIISPAAPAAGATPLPSWRPGQVLTAVVLAQTGPQSVSLRIGNQIVEAHTNIALPARAQLQLEVVQGGVQPVLRIATAPPPGATLAAALRTTLPQQQPLQAVFDALHIFTQSPASTHLPVPALALLRQLYAQMPGRADLADGEGLRRALQDSGVLLERKLAEGAAPERDLKANLLRFLSTLDPQRDEAPAKLVAAALARVELHQLNALTQPTQGLTIELPLRRDDGVEVLKFKVERDAAAGAEEPRAWTIWIDFETALIGSVRARVSWHGEAVSAQIWAQRAEGAALIQTHLHELESSLTAAGVRVEQLQCHHGTSSLDPFGQVPSGLVDVTA